VTETSALFPPRRAPARFWNTLPGSQSACWGTAALVLALVLQFHLVVTRSINWDEFWYYAQVEQFARGALAAPLQTIHVQLFQWLTALPGDGVDHIIAGRIAMFAAELVTLAAIFGISAHFTDRRTGLVYAFQHGFAFRVDPLAAATTMAALYVLLTSPLRARDVLSFSLLLGLAGMVTVKAALYAPAFAGVAWLRLAEKGGDARGTFARLAACLGGAVAVFGVLYGLHSASLGQAGLEAAGGMVDRSANYALQLGPPAYRYYLIHAVVSPLLTLLVLAAPLAIVQSSIGRERKIALAGMAATGLCVFFYVNTLAYFYAFILPPMICAACLAVDWAVRRYSSAAVAAVMALCVLALWVKEPESPIAKQRLLLDAAEEIFPEPVAYFDFCGMLGTFEKANPFMTTWGMSIYVGAGIPVMRQRMERDVVPLVLASEQQSYLTFEKMLIGTGASPYFVEEDVTALRQNYVRFWGPFWLAGKRVPANGVAVREEFLVPGPYTVHDAAVAVNGRTYAPGEIVRLDRGMHSLEGRSNSSARLVWGERLKAPDYPPPEREWWIDF
jgi:hypothetical protein